MFEEKKLSQIKVDSQQEVDKHVQGSEDSSATTKY
jgi:hypothetical protein